MVNHLDYMQYNFPLGNFMVRSLDHYGSVIKMHNQYEHLQEMSNVREEISDFPAAQRSLLACVYRTLETSPLVSQVRQLNRVMQSMYVDGLQQVRKIADSDLETYRDKQ